MDLSTYQLDEAKNFYASTFHWKYQVDEPTLEGPYLMAHLGNQYVAGIYELPQAFKKKNFPSFWMPYLNVQDANATVSQALDFEGVSIELPPTTLSDGSTIALIRDPLGAGFTVYEGVIPNRPLRAGHGIPMWFELHLSRLREVIPFYEQLFNWKVDLIGDESEALISLQDGTPIANFYELPEEFRGGYEYWIPTFQIEAMDQYLPTVKTSGGSYASIFGANRKLVFDSQGATFIVTTGISS
ncbi:putative lactoylglutathione lyase family protein [Moorena producens 3L]|uniref:Putative lactoylglutathione lyase family protein n=1 Tax=Moorena producens 3L TaxID=489825 RepID=F4XR85_9CYAN|nr:VOC family protein [Moorena producens]EGJ32900.1 putative lactoylglutathione lyase family protein [Moorena producens 3L]OLT54620.1 hypothetical protein BI334_32810 [Moorena producens 3L]